MEELNKCIMKQVSIMKEAIKDSKEREALNMELLEKNRQKSAKIELLKQNEILLQDQLTFKERKISKLNDKINVI